MTIKTDPGAVNYIDAPKPRTKKDYVWIASQLRAAATQFPEYSPDNCEKVIFNISGYKIKCRPNIEAVNSLANKIAKGVPRLKTWVQPKLPTISPLTEKGRAAIVEKYQKQARNFYSLAQSYPYQSEQYKAEGRECERLAIEIAYAGQPVETLEAQQDLAA